MQRVNFRKIGALTAIATLLIFSAGIRVLGTANFAFALDAESLPAPENIIEETGKAPTPNLEQLLESFKKRERHIKTEEQRMQATAKKLESAKESIQLQLKELEVAETRLRTLLAIADDGAENDVAQLTTVYENMKPKAAAVVFEQMQPSFAAGFLARMRPDAAALVMAGLTPETAYAISVVLAGRHAETGTN